MENYNMENYLGMHIIWWFLWLALMLWVFATPYKIPGQRLKKGSPLDILKRRFAKGEIDAQEYQEKKDLIK